MSYLIFTFYSSDLSHDEVQDGLVRVVQHFRSRFSDAAAVLQVCDASYAPRSAWYGLKHGSPTRRTLTEAPNVVPYTNACEPLTLWENYIQTENLNTSLDRVALTRRSEQENNERITTS